MVEDGVLKMEDTGQSISVYDSSPSTECSEPSMIPPSAFRLTSESSLSSSIGGFLPGGTVKRKQVKSISSTSSLSLGINLGSPSKASSSERTTDDKESGISGKFIDELRGSIGSPISARKSEKTSSTTTLSSTFSVSGLDSEK